MAGGATRVTHGPHTHVVVARDEPEVHEVVCHGGLHLVRTLGGAVLTLHAHPSINQSLTSSIHQASKQQLKPSHPSNLLGMPPDTGVLSYPPHSHCYVTDSRLDDSARHHNELFERARRAAGRASSPRSHLLQNEVNVLVSNCRVLGSEDLVRPKPDHGHELTLTYPNQSNNGIPINPTIHGARGRQGIQRRASLQLRRCIKLSPAPKHKR